MNSKLLKNGLAIYVIAGSMFLPNLTRSVLAVDSGPSESGYCTRKVTESVEQYLNDFSRPETVARVTASVLNVREGRGTDTRIMDQIEEGTIHKVTGEEQDGWVPVQVGEQHGYVYGRYVVLESQYTYTVPAQEDKEQVVRVSKETDAAQAGDINIEESDQKDQEPEQKPAFQKAQVAELEPEVTAQGDEGSSEGASRGQQVIDYACQFIGNPYVWGGTDLNNGADCSGFVQSVYKHFGVNLPRTSGEQRGAGTGVSYEDAMPGDIVCYEGHVGLYMGDGKIVNAIGRKYGIDISSATHKKILSVRRVL